VITVHFPAPLLVGVVEANAHQTGPFECADLYLHAVVSQTDTLKLPILEIGINDRPI
jgi:hypothetical protein